MKFKKCTKCQVNKPLASFSKHKNHKDGLQYQCKLCVNIYSKQYRKNNPNKIAEYQRKLRKNNSNKYAEYQRKWRENNPEYQKQWCIDNFDKYIKYRKEYRENNKDKIAKYQKQYYLENPDKQVKCRKKRYESNKIKAISYLGGKCNICGTTEQLQFHHLKLRQKGELAIAGFICSSWDTLKLKLDKCCLLCRKCHREVHKTIREINKLPSYLVNSRMIQINKYYNEENHEIRNEKVQ